MIISFGKTLAKKQTKILFSDKIVIMAILVAFLLAGCTSHKGLTLMPTPVIYQNSSINPFVHLTSAQKNIKTQVFYATNRTHKFLENKIGYGNRLDSIIHLGQATIRMGDPNSKWEDLHKASLSGDRTKPIPLTLEKNIELAMMPIKVIQSNKNLTPELQGFVDLINSELSETVDKEIMVYVHGTKVDFEHSAILAAEIDHFAGRDFVGFAFAWPSHQNILYYLLGIDVRNALHSSVALQRLLLLLSEHTVAEHINILSYSAGGKVASKALYEMRQTFSDLNASELKGKFRLGSVVFAAADVSVDIFLERIPAISELADQVVVTISDGDNALKAAKRFMGGTFRAGSSEAEKIEEAFIVSENLSNIEFIDVSIGKNVRGFDIVGHHYWYRHPWMSSDIIFLMRTDLSPFRRGLSLSELESIWYLSDDYPEKIRKAAEVELKGQW